MLNEMGYNGDWIERQLAHNDRNETRASYNGGKYLDRRRQMMRLAQLPSPMQNDPRCA